MSDVVFVEVDWEVEVEFLEGIAVVEEIEDAAGSESVEDGKVMLADDCGVLIGKAVCEATGRSAVFVASTGVVPVVKEYLRGSGLNKVSLRDRIAGRM